MAKEVSWISTEDIKKAITALMRTIYPAKKYRIYGKPDVDGYEIPAFFIDVRLADRSSKTINVVNKEYRVYIVYFQESPHAPTAEVDIYEKIDEIADLLCCTDSRNRKRNMVIEINGRYIDVTEFSADYTGKENNILSISFSLNFLDFREPDIPEPIMEGFYFDDFLEEE